MMKIEELIQCVRENACLFPENYFLFEEEGYYGFPLILIKKTSNFVFRLGLWIDSTNTCSEFNSTIYFKQIEDVFKPLLLKNQIISAYHENTSSTIWLKRIEPNLFWQTLTPCYPKVLGSEQDVMDLLKDLNEYAVNVAERFFNKWSDLRVLNSFIETVPEIEISHYLGNYGSFSKLLIYKLCNNPRFMDEFDFYCNYYIERYIREPNPEVLMTLKYNFMIDYKEVLAGTKPIYNL